MIKLVLYYSFTELISWNLLDLIILTLYFKISYFNSFYYFISFYFCMQKLLFFYIINIILFMLFVFCIFILLAPTDQDKSGYLAPALGCRSKCMKGDK